MHVCIYIYIYIHIYIQVLLSDRSGRKGRNKRPGWAETYITRRHHTCHFRKHATSAPAEGPAYGLDFERHCELSPPSPAGAEVALFTEVWCRLMMFVTGVREINAHVDNCIIAKS